jgi:hypothetical protein
VFLRVVLLGDPTKLGYSFSPPNPSIMISKGSLRRLTCALFLQLGMLVCAGQKSAGGKAGGGGGAGAQGAGAAAAPASATGSSPYLLSFDGKSANLQGIPFDAPVQLQFFVNDKINFKGIVYAGISTHYYKKKLNGDYKTFQEYYSKIVPFFDLVTVSLSPNDTLTANPDPTGLKYILNVSEPVFLAPNKHYVFGFITSITEEKKYYPKVSEALVKIIKAHNTLNRPAGSVFTKTEQDLLTKYAGYKEVADLTARYDTIKNDLKNARMYVKYVKKRAERRGLGMAKASLHQRKLAYDSAKGMPAQADSLANATNKEVIAGWTSIYKENYSNDTNAKKEFLSGMQSYSKVYNDFYKEYLIQSMPSDDYDYTDPDGQTFHKVYKLALDLAPIYNKMIPFSQKVDWGANLNYAGNPCLTKIAEYAAACSCCPGTAPGDCGLLKDTTGFINFLTGLLKPDAQNSFKSFFDSAKVRLATPTLFPQTLQNIIDTLNLAKSYFSQIRNLILFHAVSGNKSCVDTLLNSIKQNTDLFDSSAKSLTAAKKEYEDAIRADNDFTRFKFYSADSYTYSLTTRQPFKLSADIGVIDYGVNSVFRKTYGDNWNRVTPYFGIHYNFRYSNSDIPFSSIPHDHFYSLRRFSFFVGVSILSIQEQGKINNLFGSSSLLMGFGYKVNNDGLRVVFGSMLAKKVNPNPLITNTTVGFLPFIGISYDFNTIFSNMVSLIK